MFAFLAGREFESGIENCMLGRSASRPLGTGRVRSTNQNLPGWVPRLIWIQHRCPCCNSVKFKPAELRAVDGLLALFWLRPVRCMFCWRRYYWFALRDANAR